MIFSSMYLIIRKMYSEQELIDILKHKYDYFSVSHFICDCGCNKTIKCIFSEQSYPIRLYCKQFDPEYKCSFQNSSGIYCCYNTMIGLNKHIYKCPIKNRYSHLHICSTCSKNHMTPSIPSGTS